MLGTGFALTGLNGRCRLMINLVAKEVGNKWLIAIGTTRVLAFDYGAHSY